MANLANKATTTLDTRIPMGIPQRKLEVPEIEGYHLHWMRGDPTRINQALRGGYEFVEQDEVEVYSSNVANPTASGTDMGSRVSIVSGYEGGTLYLMKIKNEFFEADQATLGKVNDKIADSIRGTPSGENAYIPSAHRKAVANIFTPKR